MNKKWYTSWTLITNVCAIAVMIGEYLVTQQIIQPEIHAIVLAIVNLILRFKTNTGVTK